MNQENEPILIRNMVLIRNKVFLSPYPGPLFPKGKQDKGRTDLQLISPRGGLRGETVLIEAKEVNVAIEAKEVAKEVNVATEALIVLQGSISS